MLAGVLGLALSLVGLVLVWAGKPAVASYATTIIDTLTTSIATSESVMETTGRALGATVDSVDALSAMLSTTAAAVEDTKPVLDGIDHMMAITLPVTLQTASDSLYAAQEAAGVLESTMQSLDTFRFLLSSAPLIGDLVPKPGDTYNPEVPLAASLGELAANLETLPRTLVGISSSLSSTDEKLMSVQQNLTTMSTSVGEISSSLSEYQQMVTQSRASMDSLKSMITNLRANLATILNAAALIMTLFFIWLLAAQVVILSQGWELFQGTANRME
jgi:hypothetical protein